MKTALRMFLRSPGLAFGALVCAAVGVAATTAVTAREELSTLPRAIVPWSGVFMLVTAAVILAVGTQLPELFS